MALACLSEEPPAHEHVFDSSLLRTHERGVRIRSGMGDSGPLIATVLPVLNEEKHIEACLTSLLHQTLDSHKHMVMVLDGGSSDATCSIVTRMIEVSRESNGPRIELHENPGRFVADARNLALRLLPHSVQYTVELIGHSTFDEDHLQLRLEEWNEFETLYTEPIGAVGVKVLPREGEQSMVESWIEGSLASPLGSGDGQFSSFTERSETQIPAFAMHSRTALEKVGGWDPFFITSQDSELSMRLIDAGFILTRTPNTHVRMVKRSSLSKWWKMGHRYGFWRSKVLRKHPSRARFREFLPLIGLLLTAFFFLSIGLFLTACYATVLAIEGVRKAFTSRRISSLFGVPLCLFMLHTSFSIGLIDGMLRRGRAPSDR